MLRLEERSAKGNVCKRSTGIIESPIAFRCARLNVDS